MSDGTHRDRSNGHGYSGSSLLLMFVGGALTGAAVAYLAQSENRARVRAFARRTRARAGHLPGAMREASQAAKGAFLDAYAGEEGDAVKKHVKARPEAPAERGDA